MLRAFAPTPRWRKRVQGLQPAGPAAAFGDAIILGVAWAAPLMKTSGNRYGRRKCLCGYCGDALDVHLLQGSDGCRVASSTREQHHCRVWRIFEQRGLLPAFEAASRVLQPRDEIAFVLGSPRHWPPSLADHLPTKKGGYGPPGQPRALPEDVQAELWAAFLVTWGRWSALSWPHGIDMDAQINWDQATDDA